MMDLIDVAKVSEVKIHIRKASGEIVLELKCGKIAAPACFIFSPSEFATFVRQLVGVEARIGQKCRRD